ncbi:MAG: hypothetical protein ACRDHI_13070 [Actinomycetota bacterium]
MGPNPGITSMEHALAALRLIEAETTATDVVFATYRASDRARTSG